MRIFHLSQLKFSPLPTLASDDKLLLRQDACYLLRDDQFYQRFQQHLCVLQSDIEARSINCQILTLTDAQWLTACATATSVIKWC